MYQKYLSPGSIGIQVLSRDNIKSILTDVSPASFFEEAYVEGTILIAPSLDNARVVNHVLIID